MQDFQLLTDTVMQVDGGIFSVIVRSRLTLNVRNASNVLSC